MFLLYQTRKQTMINRIRITPDPHSVVMEHIYSSYTSISFIPVYHSRRPQYWQPPFAETIFLHWVAHHDLIR